MASSCRVPPFKLTVPEIELEGTEVICAVPPESIFKTPENAVPAPFQIRLLVPVFQVEAVEVILATEMFK